MNYGCAGACSALQRFAASLGLAARLAAVGTPPDGAVWAGLAHVSVAFRAVGSTEEAAVATHCVWARIIIAGRLSPGCACSGLSQEGEQDDPKKVPRRVQAWRRHDWGEAAFKNRGACECGGIRSHAARCRVVPAGSRCRGWAMQVAQPYRCPAGTKEVPHKIDLLGSGGKLRSGRSVLTLREVQVWQQ